MFDNVKRFEIGKNFLEEFQINSNFNLSFEQCLEEDKKLIREVIYNSYKLYEPKLIQKSMKEEDESEEEDDLDDDEIELEEKEISDDEESTDTDSTIKPIKIKKTSKSNFTKKIGNNILSSNEKEIIFNIEKIPQKENNIIKNNVHEKILGRKRNDSQRIAKHTKFSIDNVMSKIKRHLIKSTFDLLNNSFIIKKINPKEKIKSFKRISPEQGNDTKNRSNIEWLNFTVKKVFSCELSGKYKKLETQDEYNNLLFEEIEIKNEETKIIKLMKTTMREILKSYIENNKKNEFEGFKTLEDDILELRNKNETEEYIEKYKNTAENYEKNYREMISRERIGKKISFNMNNLNLHKIWKINDTNDSEYY